MKTNKFYEEIISALIINLKLQAIKKFKINTIKNNVIEIKLSFEISMLNLTYNESQQ